MTITREQYYSCYDNRYDGNDICVKCTDKLFSASELEADYARMLQTVAAKRGWKATRKYDFCRSHTGSQNYGLDLNENEPAWKHDEWSDTGFYHSRMVPGVAKTHEDNFDGFADYDIFTGTKGLRPPMGLT